MHNWSCHKLYLEGKDSSERESSSRFSCRIKIWRHVLFFERFWNMVRVPGTPPGQAEALLEDDDLSQNLSVS